MRRLFKNKSLNTFSTKFWYWHLALPIFLGALLWLVYPATGLDITLIAPFYDGSLHQFTLQHQWLLENIMHKGLKNLMVVIALALFTLWCLGLSSLQRVTFVKKLQQKYVWIHTFHSQFLWVFVGMVVTTTVVSILKHYSIHACPWDLAMYGGDQPLLNLLAALPEGASPGRCLPGGHASGGFALMAFYFAFKDSYIKFARIFLAIGLMLGLVMGYAQMMRGAHFMSHNLWTAWVVWMLLLLQYLLWQPKVNSLKNVSAKKR